MPAHASSTHHTAASPLSVCVLGAGVVGLTTATLLQAAGFSVTVVAESFPAVYSSPEQLAALKRPNVSGRAPSAAAAAGAAKKSDSDSVHFTSPTAGAHWRSDAESDPYFQGLEAATYKVLRSLVSIREAGIWEVLTFDLFPAGYKASVEDIWFKDVVRKFAVMDKKDIPNGLGERGIQFMTFCFNVPKYLTWLMRTFRRLGGKTLTKRIMHIDDGAAYGAIVVNCTGLGAKYLGGVEDANVYPTRGQTVLVRAPHVKYAISCAIPPPAAPTAAGAPATVTKNLIWSYVIPRDDGVVVLGGTFQPHNDNTTPDKQTGEEIIKRCVNMCPQLLRWPGDKLDIVGHRAGLRPTRIGGVRIEAESRGTQSVPGATSSSRNHGRYIAVHNYGHGAYGYQSSWGSAHEVLKLCRQALQHKSAHGEVLRGVKPLDRAMTHIYAAGSMKSRL
ncbi:hypothetical protein RI367_005257 [Sorochytrium milnesiophthora]